MCVPVSSVCVCVCVCVCVSAQVREYEVIDSVPFKVDFRWEKDGKPAGQTLFERNSPFPAAKVITFLRAEPFTITAVNGDTGELLSTYQVSCVHVCVRVCVCPRAGVWYVRVLVPNTAWSHVSDGRVSRLLPFP